MAATKFTPKKGQAVVAKLAAGLSITAAMASIGVNRSQYYAWRDQHPAFAEAADDAIEAGTDRLEDIAVKRAEDQSDTLLIFLLKGRRREKYGDKLAAEHTGPGGQPFTIIVERPDGS